MNRFKGYNLLGHKLNRNIHGEYNQKYGWFKCSVCHAAIYISDSHIWKNKLTCWPNDLFHTGTINQLAIEEFTLTCDEVIIKKIIE